jgi:hypothetical protein
VSTNFTIGAPGCTALHHAANGNSIAFTTHWTCAAAMKKGKLQSFPFRDLERENGFEPSTYTLARYRSTN